MADGRIKDSQITVTSVLITAYGRLARLRQNIPNWGAWCPVVSGGSRSYRNYDQHILIDLLNLTKITGIATQGRQYNGGREKVKDYKLSYRKDGGAWHFYPGKDQTAKIFLGNTDVSTVVQHDLDPTIMASNGTGILTDIKFGPANSKEFRGTGWVGWSSFFTQAQYIDIIFEFSGMRKFTNVTLTVNVAKKRYSAVFNQSWIFFSSTEDSFSNTSFLQYCPRDFPAQDNFYNANVSLSLCENTARFLKLRLYFGGEWLLITEISFNSGCNSTYTTRLQIYTTASPDNPTTTIPQINPKPKPGYDS
ncbi:Hypothetical predicted protein, partial [Paramuricea clavata]